MFIITAMKHPPNQEQTQDVYHKREPHHLHNRAVEGLYIFIYLYIIIFSHINNCNYNYKYR